MGQGNCCHSDRTLSADSVQSTDACDGRRTNKWFQTLREALPVGAQLRDVVGDVADHERQVVGIDGAQAAAAEGGAQVAEQLALDHPSLRSIVCVP